MTVPSAVGSGSNGRLVEVLMTFILCPCIMCRVSWVSARVVGVSRELGVWRVENIKPNFEETNFSLSFKNDFYFFLYPITVQNGTEFLN